ncbi:MAG TPA: hypothetical protein DCE78_04705 [Bacteroidetes bacterium]|nr:hypothetical protein [Bacteroidota bacterium]
MFNYFYNAILIGSLILIFGSGYSDKNLTQIELKHVKSFELEEEYAYDNLVNTDHYAVWYEHHTSSFYVLDLKTYEIKPIKIEKGRGPSEATWIRSAIIMENNLILYDFGNMKLIYFDLTSGAYIKEFPANLMLQSIITDGQNLYGSGLSPNGFFFKFDSTSQKFNPLPNSTMPFLDRYNMADPSFNPFKIQGSYSSCGGCILFSSYYEPILYIYSIATQRLEQYKFESIPSVDFESGRKGDMLGPPGPLKMQIESVIPIGNQSIGVLARGKSDERDYSSKFVHIFDIQTKSHKSFIQFPIELKEISISEEYIATLSKESWSIDIYEYTFRN